MTSGAHLVGALAFRTAAEAMETVATVGNGSFAWIPDGEPGDRGCWIASPRFHALFRATPGLRTVGTAGLAPIPDSFSFDLADGATAADVHIATFGFGAPAVESYAQFRRLKESGVIAPGVRFQVSLPTPFAILAMLIVPAAHEALGPVFTAAMMADLATILEAVPAEELAIQWDVAVEFGVLGQVPEAIDDLVAMLGRNGDAVPEPVALGYHLCYGTPFDEHLVEPLDAVLLVDVSNRIATAVHRSVQRIHLPVPITRDDAPYFAALCDLHLDPGTEVFLGLLHAEDGTEGATRRIAAARTALADFGVAAECGTARTRIDPVEFLRLHVDGAALNERPALGVVVPDVAPPAEVHDRVETDTRLREWAERVPCGMCAAPVGEPCHGLTGSTTRPHLSRYVTSVCETYASAPAA